MNFYFQPEDIAVLTSVLTWLVGAGGVWVVSYAISYLAEHWAGWHMLPEALRFLLPIIVSALLSWGASVALQFPDVIDMVQPYWLIIVNAVIGWIGTQKSLETAKKRGVSAKARMRANA